MNLSNIKLINDDQGIVNLVIKSKNTLINEEFINDFKKSINFISDSKKIKGIIISTDHNNYDYDYDLNFILSLKNSELIFNTITKLSKALRKLETLGKPIVSIVKGKIKLGGLEIILHSHYRIAQKNNGTKFYFKNTKYSIIPSIGGSQRLPRQIGINESINLYLSDKIISAEEALELNLVNEIVDESQLVHKAKEYIIKNPFSLQDWDNKKLLNTQPNPFSTKNLSYFISKIASLHADTQDHYPSVKILISSIYEGLNTDVNSGLKIEARNFTWLIQHIETESMLETLILNKPKEKLKDEIIDKFKKDFEENYAAEGVRLLLSGVSAALIENAGKRLDFNLGPLEFADKLEIQCVISQLDSTDASAASLIRSMQKINRNGLSNNKGFYDYKERKKNIWPDLTDLIPASKKQPSVKEIESRLLYSAINNIFYNYNKYSNLKNPEAYDYMVIKNVGFPLWTGGAFRWVQKNGIKDFINKNAEYAKTLGSRFILNDNIINIIKSI
jgi:enoyl-CoA hydratase/carnithine racemase